MRRRLSVEQFKRYLPTPDQHRLGGYETWIGVNHVQLDASMKMVNALIEMPDELKTKSP